MITIYTDGAARGNPGPGGWGAIIAEEGLVTELGGSEEHTTNNRMELTAAIRSLEFVSKLEARSSKLEAVIYTDSEYVMKGITEWIHGWVRNNWRTAAKKPVLNQELWQELLAQAQGLESLGFKLEWKHVRGHSGHSANERCDEIATSFADGVDPHLYNGESSHYKVSLS